MWCRSQICIVLADPKMTTCFAPAAEGGLQQSPPPLLLPKHPFSSDFQFYNCLIQIHNTRQKYAASVSLQFSMKYQPSAKPLKSQQNLKLCFTATSFIANFSQQLWKKKEKQPRAPIYLVPGNSNWLEAQKAVSPRPSPAALCIAAHAARCLLCLGKK